MVTSKGNFPRHCTLIDQLTRREHVYLEESDVCAFIGEYTARSGYAYSETNELIYNLKKRMDKRGRPEWRYKRQAIRRVAATLEHILSEQALNEYTFLPIPPSKARDDPQYDDRMTQVLRLIRPEQPINVRELIIQTESTPAVHDHENRLRPHQIKNLYQIDETLTSPQPVAFVIVDDMLTTGAHFKAAQSLLNERFTGVPVYGLFVARRALPAQEPPVSR